jgi:hypothetical protein
MKKYTDAELISCLRGASATLGGVLTTADYDSLARGSRFRDGRPRPTHQTHAHRFGSWRAALDAADLRANPPTPIAGKRLFESSHCIDAIRHVARQLGSTPTLREYEQFATRSGGGLPSSATIRNRLGSWSGALQAAGFQ